MGCASQSVFYPDPWQGLTGSKRVTTASRSTQAPGDGIPAPTVSLPLEKPAQDSRLGCWAVCNMEEGGVRAQGPGWGAPVPPSLGWALPCSSAPPPPGSLLGPSATFPLPCPLCPWVSSMRIDGASGRRLPTVGSEWVIGAVLHCGSPSLARLAEARQLSAPQHGGDVGQTPACPSP